MSDLSDYRLTRAERRLLRSLVGALCPPLQVRELDVADAVVDTVELFMRALPGPVRLALRAGLTTYELTARGVPRHRGRPASRLPADLAQAWLERWARGTALQRQFVYGIRGLIAMSYYEQPAVLAELGYSQAEWIEQVSRRRLAQFAPAIEAQSRAVFDADPLPLPSELRP